jgi:acetyltransferase-like isoleucine patch superfamily enzyme
VLIHDGVKLDRGVRIIAANSAKIVIGARTAIAMYSVINGGDSVEIGEDCLISGFVFLQTSMHEHKKGIKIRDQGYRHAPINIGADVWLGAHVVVMPGVTLGEGVVVGSNAVVLNSIASNCIAVGIPARTVRERE